MATPKGYPEQAKDSRIKSEYATVQKLDENRYGMDVNANFYVQEIAGDVAVEAPDAGDEAQNIKVTGHVALPGDLIRFKSGALQYKEYRVDTVSANKINLAQTPSVAASAGDLIDILRHTQPRVNSEGDISVTVSPSPIAFQETSGAVTTDVTVLDDRDTPANSKPLPVKIQEFEGGDINITAGDLNVQLSHTGANADSTQIGDGTEIMLVNADGSINSVVSATDLDVRDLDATQDNVAISDGTDTMAVNADGSINSVVSATDLDVRDLSHTQDSVRIGDGTELANVNASNELQVRDDDLNTEIAALSKDHGAAVGTEGIAMLAEDNSGNYTRLNVNASGELIVTTAAGASDPANHDEDTPHTDGDTGKHLLSVRQDTLASSTTADGDYASVKSNSLGEVYTKDTDVKTDTALMVTSLQLIDNTVKTEGAAKGTEGVPMFVEDASGNYALPQVNGSGELIVTTSATASSDVVDFMDTPLLDTSSTSIPASSSNPLEVVASLAAGVKKVQLIDTTGAYIGLYTGAALSETLVGIFAPGNDQTLEIDIAPTTRISLRNMENSAISEGLVAINFIG